MRGTGHKDDQPGLVHAGRSTPAPRIYGTLAQPTKLERGCMYDWRCRRAGSYKVSLRHGTYSAFSDEEGFVLDYTILFGSAAGVLFMLMAHDGDGRGGEGQAVRARR